MAFGLADSNIAKRCRCKTYPINLVGRNTGWHEKSGTQVCGVLPESMESLCPVMVLWTQSVSVFVDGLHVGARLAPNGDFSVENILDFQSCGVL